MVFLRNTLLLLICYTLPLGVHSQDGDTLHIITPLKFQENVQLKGYDIHESYKLSEEHFVLIGQPEETDPYNQGLRLIHLRKREDRFKVEYLSYGAWESFIYRPTFFQGKDKLVVICEMGAEYSWGMDAFMLEADSMRKLGNMNLAARYYFDEHQESAVPFLLITEKAKSLSFDFLTEVILEGRSIQSTRLYYRPGQPDESLIRNEKIHYVYDPVNGWEERLD